MLITDANNLLLEAEILFESPIIPPELSKAIYSAGICEIFGPSGSGKTALALSVTLHHLIEFEDSKVVYICCDGPFPVTRLLQMIPQSLLDYQNSILDRVIVQHIGDATSLEHYCCYLLANLVQQAGARLVIIDTIASNFRTLDRTKDITHSMYAIAHRLSYFEYIFGCRSLVINQVTDYVDPIRDLNIPDDALIFRPSLGLSWFNCVSKRLSLRKVSDECGNLRCLRFMKSPYFGCIELYFRIGPTGLIWEL